MMKKSAEYYAARANRLEANEKDNQKIVNKLRREARKAKSAN